MIFGEKIELKVYANQHESFTPVISLRMYARARSKLVNIQIMNVYECNEKNIFMR